MSGLGQVFTGVVLVALWAAPLVLARLRADTLDRAPYAISLAAGVGVAVLLGALRWPALRGALAGGGGARAGATLTVIALGFCPPWAVGVGLGVNRLLDRSPPTTHVCRVLQWQPRAKGPARCRVSSWRDREAEVLTAAQVQSAADEGPVPARCVPGRSLQVTTRAGALGWEWVAEVL